MGNEMGNSNVTALQEQDNNDVHATEENSEAIRPSGHAGAINEEAVNNEAVIDQPVAGSHAEDGEENQKSHEHAVPSSMGDQTQEETTNGNETMEERKEPTLNTPIASQDSVDQRRKPGVMAISAEYSTIDESRNKVQGNTECENGVAQVDQSTDLDIKVDDFEDETQQALEMKFGSGSLENVNESQGEEAVPNRSSINEEKTELLGKETQSVLPDPPTQDHNEPSMKPEREHESGREEIKESENHSVKLQDASDYLGLNDKENELDFERKIEINKLEVPPSEFSSPPNDSSSEKLDHVSIQVREPPTYGAPESEITGSTTVHKDEKEVSGPKIELELDYSEEKRELQEYESPESESKAPANVADEDKEVEGAITEIPSASVLEEKEVPEPVDPENVKETDAQNHLKSEMEIKDDFAIENTSEQIEKEGDSATSSSDAVSTDHSVKEATMEQPRCLNSKEVNEKVKPIGTTGNSPDAVDQSLEDKETPHISNRLQADKKEEMDKAKEKDGDFANPVNQEEQTSQEDLEVVKNVDFEDPKSGTQVSIPETESDESAQAQYPSPNQREIPTIQRTDSGKMRTPLKSFFDGQTYVVPESSKEETATVKAVDEVWSPPAKIITTNTPTGRYKSKSWFLFGNCICCAAAIH
ncbi:protein IWS1 homolog [Amborella trichopoda]|uniref:Uncharacterized protein n=1 Tax=Amborella trichopoda TaxID=13333 RepID=W1P3E4_AMBTC|nr:protein IWS1 homolog [Amborella trichopoda]XP_020519855.1 protein IWS1 homolog [Amborella trichopoda]XP_020519856.1 protein IWS1 homolog [Amborella trichopoda]ERN01480.1 hypothetical protein AMTR_s00002p00269700 [Amborella trichopoda]|eukprot:XP_020519854.1 protein IWS1 homolog [Amborella trichopoda]